MRIGFVRRNFSIYGGAENFLIRFVQEIKKFGYESVFFSSEDKNKIVGEYDEIINIKSLNSKLKKFLDPIEFADGFDEIKPKKFCDIIFSFERIWDCDIYRLGDGLHVSWLDKVAKNDFFLSNFFRNMKRKNKQILKLERNLVERCRSGKCLFVANSRMVADELRDCYGLDNSGSNLDKKIYVVQNGYEFPNEILSKSFTKSYDMSESKKNLNNDLILYKKIQDVRVAQREKLGIGKNDFCVIFVGTGWKRKGLKSLIDSFIRFKCLINYKKNNSSKVKLLVVGKEKGLCRDEDIIFFGKVNDSYKYLCVSDLFALPTIYDPFSNATLEAAFFGLPVITSMFNGCCEVLSDGKNASLLSSNEMNKNFSDKIKYWWDYYVEHNYSMENIWKYNKDIRATYTMSNNVEKTLKLINHFV